jgi:hypothetical protein
VGEAQGDPDAPGRARLAVALGQAEQGLGQAALDIQGQQVVEAAGVASRKAQNWSRPIAQAVVGDAARAPAVRRPSVSRASSPMSCPARTIEWTCSAPPRTGETMATSPAVRTTTKSAGSPWRIRKLPAG